jgi:hypothetical protein
MCFLGAGAAGPGARPRDCSDLLSDEVVAEQLTRFGFLLSSCRGCPLLTFVMPDTPETCIRTCTTDEVLTAAARATGL